MIVYTAIFGGYDRPRPAPPSGVLFTDREPDPALGWDVRVVEAPYPDNLARSNRFYKLQPHAHFPLAERVLYLDGGMELRGTPTEVLRAFQAEAGGDHDVFTLRHPLGHCARDEALWVASKGITHQRVLRRQTERYRQRGVPGDLPGAEPRLIIAKLNDRTRAFFDAWWHEVEHYSHRDQVSFPFAVWSTGADVHLAPFTRMRALWEHRPHRKPQMRGAA